MPLAEICTRAECLLYLGRGNSLTEDEDALLNMIKPMAENAIRQHLQIGVTQPIDSNGSTVDVTRLLPHGNPLDVRDAWDSPFRNTFDNQGLAFQGRGLQLEAPVRSITSVHEDRGAHAGTAAGAFGSNTELTEGEDWYQDLDDSGINRSGIIWRIGTAWPSRPRSVRVIFLHGYSEDELLGNVSDWLLDVSQIRYACIQTVAESFNEARNQQSGQGGSGGPVKSERLGDYAVTYDTKHVGPKVVIPDDAMQRLEPFMKVSQWVM